MTSDLHRLPVAERWWRAVRVSPRVTRIWEPHVTPLLRCNIWHVRGRDRDLLVDSGLGVTSLRRAFPSLFDREPVVVVTHSHHDHVGGLHEFFDRRGHPSEAPLVAEPPVEPGSGLLALGIPSDELEHLLDVGYDVPPVLVDAVPSPDFEVAGYDVLPAPFTDVLVEGDRIDLGDCSFGVVHLPGHTPGSIGLFDEASGVLFSGDAVYDGPLLDGLPESDIGAYVVTMGKLLDLPVRVVYAGHDEIFNRERLVQLATHYISMHLRVAASPLTLEGEPT